MPDRINRRSFIESTALSAAGISVVPRQVLGGPGYVAPSDKINLAYVGCGTEGLREMLPLLEMPDVQIVAVCDPNRSSDDYVDWTRNELRDSIRKTLDKPTWGEGFEGIPGGRDVAKDIVETRYGAERPSGSFKGCASYADYRELLAIEKDVDTVRVMTPDHLHSFIAIAAMQAGKRVVTHKPLGNRVKEARLVVETARRTGLGAFFMPASDGALIHVIKGWIDDGAIGKLREIHNWSNRPVWPQYAKLPTDTPPVPKGFDWQLWLGPSLDRPYHPNYTHAVFRGWYEFGGGAIADMGHYSLWPVFTEFGLDAPVSVESTPSHVCEIVDHVSVTIKNDYAFPFASTLRFKFASKGKRPALELFWYDGGIKPRTPDELISDQQELEREGMLFVGDKGKILAGFRGENPRLIPESAMRKFRKQRRLPEEKPAGQAPGQAALKERVWIDAFKKGGRTYGDFLLAGPISDMINLGAVSLRLGGKRLLWDAAKAAITNAPEANQYLARECRKGWELPER